MIRHAALMLCATLWLGAQSAISPSAVANAATLCRVSKHSNGSKSVGVQVVQRLLLSSGSSVTAQRRALLSLAKSPDPQADQLIYRALEHRHARVREAAVWTLAQRRLTTEAIAAIVGRGLVEWHAGTRHAITQTLRHFVAGSGGHITRSIHE